MRRLKKWQEKEEARLISLYNEGLTLPEIAEQLNRTKDSVSHRIALLKQSKELRQRIYKANMEGIYYNTTLKEIDKFYQKKSKYAELNKTNYDLIVKYDKRNKTDELTPSTRAGKISDITVVANYLNQSLLTVTVNEVENFFNEYREKGNKIVTKKSRLKEFYKFLVEKYPENKKVMQVYLYLTRKSKGRKKRKAELTEIKDRLTKREIVKMVASIKGNDFVSTRDRALIASLYDSAARRSEIIAIRVKDAKLDGKYPHFYLPESKTVPRDSPLLSFSLPYLLEYRNGHRFLNNDDAAFFYSASTSNYGEALTDTMVNLIVKRAAKLAKIRKNVSPHILRDSKIVHTAQDHAGDITTAEANTLFGWGRTSGMFAYYSSITSEELKKRELERQGQLSKEELEEREAEKTAFKTIYCKRCRTKVLPDQYVCSRCGLAREAVMSKADRDKDRELKRVTTELSDIQKKLKYVEKFEKLMKRK